MNSSDRLNVTWTDRLKAIFTSELHRNQEVKEDFTPLSWINPIFWKQSTIPNRFPSWSAAPRTAAYRFQPQHHSKCPAVIYPNWPTLRKPLWRWLRLLFLFSPNFDRVWHAGHQSWSVGIQFPSTWYSPCRIERDLLKSATGCGVTRPLWTLIVALKSNGARKCGYVYSKSKINMEIIAGLAGVDKSSAF